METNRKHILITGGAGYIGSMLTGVLLNNDYHVSVVDKFLFGGESLLGYRYHPGFQVTAADICDPETVQIQDGKLKVGTLEPESYAGIVHLAAIVGYPACQAAGKEVSFRINTEATQRLFDLAEQAGVERFIFSSTYSNYGLSKDGLPVTEQSPLYPQSLYAETKIAAEQYLYGQGALSRCAPIVYRFATLFGISPRTRFDLIINQFVLEAMTRHKLVIYQGNFSRAFIHVREIGNAIRLALESPLDLVRGQIFNVGADNANYMKDEIVDLVKHSVPGTEIEYRDLSFGGDMRDIRVSFAKIRERLGFIPQITVEAGTCEVRDALKNGIISNPLDTRYRNAHFIVQ